MSIWLNAACEEEKYKLTEHLNSNRLFKDLLGQNAYFCTENCPKLDSIGLIAILEGEGDC